MHTALLLWCGPQDIGRDIECLQQDGQALAGQVQELKDTALQVGVTRLTGSHQYCHCGLLCFGAKNASLLSSVLDVETHMLLLGPVSYQRCCLQVGVTRSIGLPQC